ncbi:MAG: hypothetical protein QXY45_04310 [Candidatus Aenigmatarchaeota archaeon]
MNKLLFFVPILLSIVLTEARVFPNYVTFYYPMNIEKIEKNVEYFQEDSWFERKSKDYTIGIKNNGMIIMCNKPDEECLDEKKFRNILDDVEKDGAFDLSGEDKDKIGSLYQNGIIIKKVPKNKVFLLKFKANLLKGLGRVFCVNYQIIQKCNDPWCSFIEYPGDKCPGL